MSKESIIKDLPDAFVRQMRNWVKTGAALGRCAISSAYDGMPSNPPYGPRIPTINEGSHLDRALDSLPNRERLAVMLFWIYEGNDLVWLGRRLHCDYRTVEVRVRSGHDLLRRELARLEAAHDRMLARLATGQFAIEPVDNRKLQV